MKKYMAIGGSIISKNDGESHHVSAKKLCQLYKVDPAECILIDVHDKDKLLGVDTTKLIELRPDRHGIYKTPKKEFEE